MRSHSRAAPHQQFPDAFDHHLAALVEDLALEGDDAAVGRFALVHACTVEPLVVVADAAIVMDDAHVGAGALIPEGKVIPDNSMVMGSPGKVVREISEQNAMLIKMSALHYVENFKRYKTDLQRDERA